MPGGIVCQHGHIRHIGDINAIQFTRIPVIALPHRDRRRLHQLHPHLLRGILRVGGEQHRRGSRDVGACHGGAVPRFIAPGIFVRRIIRNRTFDRYSRRRDIHTLAEIAEIRANNRKTVAIPVLTGSGHCDDIVEVCRGVASRVRVVVSGRHHHRDPRLDGLIDRFLLRIALTGTAKAHIDHIHVLFDGIPDTQNDLHRSAVASFIQHPHRQHLHVIQRTVHHSAGNVSSVPIFIIRLIVIPDKIVAFVDQMFPQELVLLHDAGVHNGHHDVREP